MNLPDYSGIRVLVGCETSGRVRDAMLSLGADAWSCDLLPADTPTNRHIQDDIRSVLKYSDWDLLFVAHPPCTRLCNSGVRWLNKPPTKLNAAHHSKEECEAYLKMSEEEQLAFMWADLDRGAQLFSDCLHADVPFVCVENPVMHKHAKARIRDLPTPQTVQPHWFGDAAFKATGLYMKNLPFLTKTKPLTPPEKGTVEYKKWSAVHLAPPGPDRWKLRSATFKGVAEAIASQFLAHINRVSTL